MDYKKLGQLLGGDEFTELFDDMVEQEVREQGSRRYSTNPRKDQLIMHEADVMALENYLAMIDMFDNYPALTSIIPKWKVVVDVDSSMHIAFSVEIEYVAGNETHHDTCRYDCFPEDALGDSKTFDDFVEAGELFGPEHWNNLINMGLFTRDKPYESRDEVLGEMNSELEHILPEIKKWALGKIAQESTYEPRPAKSSMKM